jgi:hypothetical protein
VRRAGRPSPLLLLMFAYYAEVCVGGLRERESAWCGPFLSHAPSAARRRRWRWSRAAAPASPPAPAARRGSADCSVVFSNVSSMVGCSKVHRGPPRGSGLSVAPRKPFGGAVPLFTLPRFTMETGCSAPLSRTKRRQPRPPRWSASHGWKTGAGCTAPVLSAPAPPRGVGCSFCC